ncbi:MAG: N-acetyl-gamma-glutamyl-phosphate reductase [Armatimonadetes bacterium]|nr:N-acetyl-gamma-glutamyl-phosphate reductase [Armatimonadota bacterium]
MISVGILGGTGFGAGELLRILANHPVAKVVAATSRSSAGSGYDSVHPHLTSIYDAAFVASLEDAGFGDQANQCVFSALPHGESGKAVEEVLAKFPETKVIDLSGDLRLRDLDQHREHYGHSPDLEAIRQEAAYGLTEVNSEAVVGARVVANPGCLATASALALLPFENRDLKSVHQHLATGSSGSGKDPKASTHHPVRHANFLAYKALEHQHVPEVVQVLQDHHVKVDNLPFVAHSLPISRGILATTFVELNAPSTQENIEYLFAEYYVGKPFIRLRGAKPAEIENVVGSNFCDISIKVKGNQVVIHTAIDNLVKGMAGQAIHNMNLMFGLPETTGLWFGGWRPV